MAELTDEELAGLRQLAGIAPSLVGLVQTFEQGEGPDDFEGYELDDDQGDGGELVGAGGGVVLSNEHTNGDLFDLSADDWGLDEVDAGAGGGESVELSQVREQLAGVQAELHATRWAAQRAEYEQAGVPPVMLDKAEVLLSQPGAASVIELSNGTTVDPVGVLREVLDSARGLVDLSAPLGHSQDRGEDTKLEALHSELDKFGDV